MRRGIVGAAVVLLPLALLLPGASAAQQALVLSGGGSRGLAHAGAIQGLEERGHDPDLVVGTSMGAIIGALYAAGYTPEELRERVFSVDWAGLFAATPVVIGAAAEVRYPMIGLDLDTDPLRFSRGLLGQWRINRALAGLLFDANARSRGDFDRLPRRYRAVAADLETGELILLGEGDLARAVRASMALPGFFAPVRWGERVLVDGGIADNIPTAAARDLGARYVVAVDVGRPPEKIHSQAPLAVIQRSIDLMQDNMQRDTVPPDALVVPDIPPGQIFMSFPDDPEPLLELGLEAARRDLPPGPAAGGGGTRTGPAAPASLGALVVEAPDSALAALARRIFRDVAPGPYDPAAVRAAMDRLYTTGLVEGVWPRLEGEDADDDVAPALVVRLDAHPVASLDGAVGFENDRGGRGWLALSRYAALLRRPAVLTGALSTTGIERWASASARVYFLSRPALAWSVGGFAGESDVRFFADDVRGGTEVVRLGGWAGLELPYVLADRHGTALLRGEWVHVETGGSGLSLGPFVRVTSINPDLLVVGTPLLLEGEVRWGEFAYRRVAAGGSVERRLGALRLAAVADARAVSGGAPPDLHPALGDQHAIPGLRWGQIRARARVTGGVDAALPLLGGFARVRLRAGAAPERLSALDDARWHAGGELGGVWQSPLGLVEAGVGVSTRGDARLDVNVGRRF